MSDRIENLLRRAFNLPRAFVFKDSMGPNDVPGWDSLGQLLLIQAIEDELQLTLTDDDVLRIETVGTVRELLSQKGRL